MAGSTKRGRSSSWSVLLLLLQLLLLQLLLFLT